MNASGNKKGRNFKERWQENFTSFPLPIIQKAHSRRSPRVPQTPSKGGVDIVVGGLWRLREAGFGCLCHPIHSLSSQRTRQVGQSITLGVVFSGEERGMAIARLKAQMSHDVNQLEHSPHATL